MQCFCNAAEMYNLLLHGMNTLIATFNLAMDDLIDQLNL
jgi:hypothetical protein